MSTTLIARPVSSVDINTRVEAIDWASISTHLDNHGWAMLKTLLTAGECESITGLYEDDRRFRSPGNAVVFAVHDRPVQGTRGTYRVRTRHGVSRLRSGHRHTVGVIFHDAK